MGNSEQLRVVAEQLEKAEALLQSAKLTVEMEKSIADALSGIVDTPLNYQETFGKKLDSIVSRAKSSLATSITVKVEVKERRENAQKFLEKMLVVIPIFKKQLVEMKGCGYFVPDWTVSKSKTEWIIRPREGVVGDKGLSRRIRTHVIPKKQMFSDKNINDLVKELSEIKEAVIQRLKETKALQVESVLGEVSMKVIERDCHSKRDQLAEIYRIINGQFKPKELDKDIRDIEISMASETFREIKAIIQTKCVTFTEHEKIVPDVGQEPQKRSFFKKILTRPEFSLTEGSNLIFHCPEMKELVEISLGNTKDVPNPSYNRQKEELQRLEQVVLEIKKQCNM